MFTVELVTDTVSIPASEVYTANPTALLHAYIDAKYPDRVLMDAGLVVGRYDKFRLRTAGPATLSAGGRANYQCTFAVVVFRPWTGEILVGRIVDANAEGLTVSTGFCACIHVPKRWMLNPSTFKKKEGVWVWTPVFEDEEEEDGGGGNEGAAGGDEGGGFDMYIGAEIRCRVKSIHFTRVTHTAKGVQAVTSMQGMTTTPADSHHHHSHVSNNNDSSSNNINCSSADNTTKNNQMLPPQQQPVRRRSSSVGLQAENSTRHPAMHIVASIREDGLGLVEWWNNDGDTLMRDHEDDDDDDNEE